jgi:hypothetical protein
MYSPKMKKDLIPILYKLAKREGIPMTKLVDEMLRSEIAKRAGQIHQIKNEDVPVQRWKLIEMMIIGEYRRLLLRLYGIINFMNCLIRERLSRSSQSWILIQKYFFVGLLILIPNIYG